jgi:cell wall-associated NlpC family hydrolase
MKKVFYGVNGLCALDPKSLDIPISKDETVKFLEKEGFEFKPVSLAQVARGCIGSSVYEQGAPQSLAPKIVECRSFIGWSYAQLGILISTLNLRSEGRELNPSERLALGDLVFVSNNDKKSPSGGHVAMATSDSTVIHAQAEVNVQEIPLAKLLENEKLRRVVRIADNIDSILTFRCPASKHVMCSLDFESILNPVLPT